MLFRSRTAAGAAVAGAGLLAAGETLNAAGQPAPHGRRLEGVTRSPLSLTPEQEKPNSWEQITSYNNYYEFGTDKDSPSLIAGRLKVDPWSVQVEGECQRTGKYGLEDILKGQALEERIYRLRCVEAWSMVIPWIGFQIGRAHV